MKLKRKKPDTHRSAYRVLYYFPVEEPLPEEPDPDLLSEPPEAGGVNSLFDFPLPAGGAIFPPFCS
jgi:hypothetical protein